MVDRSYFRTGKQPARIDPRVPHIGRFLAVAPLPAPPDAVDWLAKVPGWPMLGNDTVGDCAPVACLHALQQWSAYTGATPFTPTTDEALALYSAITGYNPADPTTDKGSVLVDVLAYWLSAGITLPAGLDRLAAYTAVDPKNPVHIKQAISIFGGLYVGLNLPISAQTQAVWDVPAGGAVGDGAPGSWDGHCVYIAGYDADGLTCVTWGETLRMSWAFLAAYSDEAFAMVSKDFLTAAGTSPSGPALAQLEADLQAVREL